MPQPNLPLLLMPVILGSVTARCSLHPEAQMGLAELKTGSDDTILVFSDGGMNMDWFCCCTTDRSGVPGFSSHPNGTDTTSFTGGATGFAVRAAAGFQSFLGIPGLSSHTNGTDIGCLSRLLPLFAGATVFFPMQMQWNFLCFFLMQVYLSSSPSQAGRGPAWKITKYAEMETILW